MSKKKVLSISVIIILIIVIVIAAFAISKKGSNEEEEIVEEKIASVIEISDNQTLSDSAYASEEADKSVIAVKENAGLVGARLTINKLGDSTDLNKSKENGLNSAIIAQAGAKIKIHDSKIITEGEGATALFSNGENSKIDISNVKINTLKNSALGAIISSGGELKADNSEIITNSENSPIVRFNDGNDNAKFENCVLKTTKENSPLFYVSKGNAIVSLDNCEVNLENNKIATVVGEKTDDGENPGELFLNAKNQTLIGDVEVDCVSTFMLSLDNSNFTGKINSERTGRNVSILINDEASKFTITGDCYVTSIADKDPSLKNIVSNGSTIYYDSSNDGNGWLDGKTIYLFDGGKIAPLN